MENLTGYEPNGSGTGSGQHGVDVMLAAGYQVQAAGSTAQASTAHAQAVPVSLGQSLVDSFNMLLDALMDDFDQPNAAIVGAARGDPTQRSQPSGAAQGDLVQTSRMPTPMTRGGSVLEFERRHGRLEHAL